MSDSPRPSLTDITRTMVQLADRILTEKGKKLEPVIENTLRLVMRELELHIPGYEAPSNAEAAKDFTEAGEIALRNKDERVALSFALRGLSCSLHDPALWCVGGRAYVEIGGIVTALRMLHHALWIHPGYEAAQNELDALTSFHDVPEQWDRLPAAPDPMWRDIRQALELIGDHVQATRGIDPFTVNSVGKLLLELKADIPGYSPLTAKDIQHAEKHRRAAITLQRVRIYHHAFREALHGLSWSPHDPELWHLAGVSSFELDNLELALLMLHHSVWIFPGDSQAHRDLDALTSQFEGEEPGEEKKA